MLQVAASGGAQVLGLSSTADLNGDYWALVRLQPGPPVFFGKLVSSWAPGQRTVTLTPCNEAGTVASPTPANVTVNVYGVAGIAGTSGSGAGNMATVSYPVMFDAPPNTVLLYQALGTQLYLVSPPVFTVPTSGAVYTDVQTLGGPTGPATWGPIRTGS